MGSYSVTQRLTGGAIKYVEPVARGRAKGLVAEVYAQAEREFALLPPLTMHSADPDILAVFWGLTREAYIVGRAGRADRELVAAAVSQSNACPFCVEAHSAMLHATANHEQASEVLDARRVRSSGHPLVQWALATRTPGAAILNNAPFAEHDGPQLRATAILFHYLNRMVNVFLEPSPSPVALHSRGVKNLVGRALGALVGTRIVSVDAKPGLGLAFLPDAPLQPEFAWAKTAPAVARALATFSATIERRGEEVIRPRVRQVAEDRLSCWNGDDPGLSMQWVEEAIAGLSREDERAAARLVLLAGLASYRVDQSAIAAFRKHRPEPADLIATTAWASLQAARRIAGWIGPAPNASDPTDKN
jgi:AhpD family alkylhydroperoxidase